jgi:uncharacterized protein
MTSKSDVENFISLRNLAIVGVSRSGNKFGNNTFRELTAHGYRLFPIHPEAQTLEGVTAYKDFVSLPEKVDGLIVIVPPAQAERVVREAAAAGIKHIWFQQGAESESAISYCRENGIAEVHGECINMFARDTATFHKIHRGIWKIIGKLPK